MEGKDFMFSDALNSIEESIARQEEEIKEKENTKKGPAGDPLKQAKPTELKGDGEGNVNKLAHNKQSKVNTKKGPAGDPLKQSTPTQLKSSKGAQEGIDPESEGKGDLEDEAKKIEKLTEALNEAEGLADEVKALITRAKEALDGEEYEKAQELVSQLSNIKMTVGMASPEKAATNPVEPEPEPELPEDGPMHEPMPPMESREDELEVKESEEDTHNSFDEAFIMDDELQESIDRIYDAGLDIIEREFKVKFNRDDYLESDYPSIMIQEFEDYLNVEGMSPKSALFKITRAFGVSYDEAKKIIFQQGGLNLADYPEIQESVFIEAKKKNPKAKTRNRGDVVFPAESPKVTDDKDHFPINNQNQARNALARANQYSSAPKWYKGSLDSLVKKVASAVHRKYKDIKVTKKAETPGKG